MHVRVNVCVSKCAKSRDRIADCGPVMDNVGGMDDTPLTPHPDDCDDAHGPGEMGIGGGVMQAVYGDTPSPIGGPLAREHSRSVHLFNQSHGVRWCWWVWPLELLPWKRRWAQRW